MHGAALSRTKSSGVCVAASLPHHAPILSEMGACVLPHGHDGDHRDPWGRTWNVIPLHRTANTGRGTAE